MTQTRPSTAVVWQNVDEPDNKKHPDHPFKYIYEDLREQVLTLLTNNLRFREI